MADGDISSKGEAESLACVPVLEPLRIEEVTRTSDDESTGGHNALLMTFNRPPTDDELEHMRRLPPSIRIANDALRYAERAILAELAVRLFRTLVLSGMVLTETPAALDWLRDWIDGTHEGHGPIGQPMTWPNRLTGICGLLRQWGFEPTPTIPPYVTRQQRMNGRPS